MLEYTANEAIKSSICYVMSKIKDAACDGKSEIIFDSLSDIQIAVIKEQGYVVTYSPGYFKDEYTVKR